MTPRNARGHRVADPGRFWRSTFNTPLGWMSLIGAGPAVARLVFGHGTPAAAVEALGEPWRWGAVEGGGEYGSDIRERLERYASGEPAEFDDVIVKQIESASPGDSR